MSTNIVRKQIERALRATFLEIRAVDRAKKAGRRERLAELHDQVRLIDEAFERLNFK